jgi:predicted Zn-dependent peptidase
VDELKDLHTRAYNPDLLVVAAAGSVDHDRLVEILVRTGWGERRANPEGTPDIPPVVASAPSRQHVARSGSQTHIVFGSPTLGYKDPRRHAMVLLSVVMGGGMSSRLFQRIREELGLAYAVYTFQTFYATCGIHGVYVGTAPKTADAALEAIEKELAAIVDAGLTEEEIAQGKGQLKGQLTLSLESPTSRMYRAAAIDLYGEPYRSLDEMLARVDAIAPETIHELAREYFAPTSQTVLSLGPGKQKGRARSQRPRQRG